MMKAVTTYTHFDEDAGKKNDKAKTRFDLLQADFELAIAQVLTHGAKKYGANNWQKVEEPTERYYAALRRHLSAWRMGKKMDEESGLPHLAHVACNVMFLMHFDKEQEEEDGGLE